jgi:hypothetical protein
MCGVLQRLFFFFFFLTASLGGAIPGGVFDLAKVWTIFFPISFLVLGDWMYDLTSHVGVAHHHLSRLESGVFAACFLLLLFFLSFLLSFSFIFLFIFSFFFLSFFFFFFSIFSFLLYIPIPRSSPAAVTGPKGQSLYSTTGHRPQEQTRHFSQQPATGPRNRLFSQLPVLQAIRILLNCQRLELGFRQ